MAFHARLKELREKAGLTQDGLAARAGLSKAGIANLEQDRTKPAWETLQKLATALGVGVEAFSQPAESDEKRERGRPRKPALDAAAGPAAGAEAKAGGKGKLGKKGPR